VRGWVIATGCLPPPNVPVRPVLELVSCGPSPEVVELCRWAASRFAGRLRPLLLAASPDRIVRQGKGPSRPGRPAGLTALGDGSPPGLLAEALETKEAVIELGPLEERIGFVARVIERYERVLVLVESRYDAARLARLLRRAGQPVASYPEDWAATRAGGVVVGTRNAVFCSGSFRAIVVLDAHSEAYRSERSPNFDSRLVAAERARREEAALFYLSPAPPLELTWSRPTLRLSEPAGWGLFSVLDSKDEDPNEGGYPSLVVSWIRAAVQKEEAAGEKGRPVVCILNRVGRARLLSCNSCRSVAACEACGAALTQLERPQKGDVGTLSCPRCGAEQEALCPSCGSPRLRVARAGVKRAREQLEAVTGLPVAEMSGPKAAVPAGSLVMATQAALHRLSAASLVVWLDFDQELLAPRFRAGEEALVLLARSARLVGRAERGRVVVRTSLPDHEVILAAKSGQPSLLRTVEEERRRLLSLPPFAGLARLEGDGAEALVAELPEGVQVTRAGSGYLLRGASDEELAAVLSEMAAREPAGWAGLDAKVEMEPLDL
jgi:primosomal protein N' (replication factor Y)